MHLATSRAVPGAARAWGDWALARLEFAQATDPGRARDHNEDYLGHARPETAAARAFARMAVRAGGWRRRPRSGRSRFARWPWNICSPGFAEAPAGEPCARSCRAVQSANLHVYETGKQAGPGGLAMATTIVACALRHDRATVAHVDDSRCYLIRKRQRRNSHARSHRGRRAGAPRNPLRRAAGAPQPAASNLLSRSIGDQPLRLRRISTSTPCFPAIVLRSAPTAYIIAVRRRRYRAPPRRPRRPPRRCRATDRRACEPERRQR